VAILALLSLLAILPAAASRADVYSDDFTGNWPYSLDLPNGIWTGTYNMSALNGAMFEADPDGNGQLVVQNNAGESYGWSGSDSNAPLVYFDVDGGLDWTAEVTIDAQTNVTWSAAGFVARAKTGTLPGVGTTNDFIAYYSFRYWEAAGDPTLENNGATLLKRIENGVQIDDILNPGYLVSLPDGSLPYTLRLVRQGKDFLGYISVDDGATWLHQSTVTVSDASPLADPTIPIEFGLAYQTFDGSAGEARFDDFSLETYARVPEPGSLALLFVALAGSICGMRRR
jgi:hypothetical protein